MAQVNPNYMEINVEKALEDPDSIYHHYRSLIRLRSENPAAIYGSYDLLLADHPQIYGYTRTLGEERPLSSAICSQRKRMHSFPMTFPVGQWSCCWPIIRQRRRGAQGSLF